jgi:hypothetical protein
MATIKSTTKKTTKKTVKKAAVANAPVTDKLPCGCNADCACGGNCAEHKHCKCHKRGWFKKLILVLVIFALGFASAKVTCCNKKTHIPMPKPEFSNGCLIVKSQKMAQMAPEMDADKNGCITHEEYRIARRKMFKRPENKFKRPAKPVVQETQPETQPEAQPEAQQ